MINAYRMVLCTGLFLVFCTATRNDALTVPSTSDLPESIRQSSALNEVILADSLVSRGALLASLARYRLAERTLAESVKPDDEAVGWLGLKIAHTLIQSDQPTAARAQLDDIITRMPDSRWAAAAHDEIGGLLAAAGRYSEALPHFQSSLKHADPSDAGRLSFRVAYGHQQLGHWAEAVTWYDRARSAYPVLGDYALFFSAQCLQKLNRSDDAYDRVRALADAYPHSLFQAEAITLIYDHLSSSGRFDEAIAGAMRPLREDHALATDQCAEMITRIGKAHESAARSDSALAYYRVILADYRMAKTAVPALSSFSEIKAGRGERLSDEEKLWSGLIYINHKEYGKAIQILESMTRSSQNDTLASQGAYYLARAQYLAGQSRAAESAFRRFLVQYPNHDFAASSAFHVARCVRQIQGTTASLPVYLDFVTKYPKAPAAPEALLFVAQRYEEANRKTDAAKIFHRVASEYPTYKDADESRWQEGYIYYRLKRYDQAAEVFRQLALEFPKSPYASKALYWSGKAARRLSRPDAEARYREVIRTYGGSYYAYQAARQLEDLKGKFLLAPLNKKPVIAGNITLPTMHMDLLQDVFGHTPSMPIVEGIHLERAEALFRIGLREEGTKEAELVKDLNPDNPIALGEVTRLYFRYRYYREGIRTANILQAVLEKRMETGGRPLPDYFIYPAPFWTQVVEQAEKLGVDPLFLLAIMRQESRFDPWITSWVGARGLMQLMPATAKHLAKQMGINDYAPRRLYEPEISISMGSRYMAQLLRRFDGSPQLALAAYNGGPTRVARWVRAQGVDDIDEFVERISLHETRYFVKAVMENYARYTYYMGDGKVSIVPSHPTQ